MSKKINVMLVEDHIGFRTILIRALKHAEEIEHISPFSTAEIAMRTLENMSPRERPHILLLDLNLPGMSGLESIRWFKEYSPKLKIIILTQSSNEEDILEAIAHGASGYLLKSATVAQIVEAIETVVSGGASLNPKVAKFILKTVNEASPKKSPIKKDLSERELEILTLIAQGHARKEISMQLKITVNTVSYHVDHIYEKLNVVNAPAAVSAAYQKGILPGGRKKPS
jgi:DNA-binding NarL/FixJ family response regulator